MPVPKKKRTIKTYGALATYRHAKRFADAGLLIERCIGDVSKKTEVSIELMIPRLVFSSFACELILKSMIEDEGGVIEEKHDLHVLYQLLKLDTKTVCESILNHRGSCKLSFVDELLAASHIFHKSRYANEDLGGYSANNIFIPEFFTALEGILISIHPEWAISYIPNSATLLDEPRKYYNPKV